jgi:hypothetical protein
MKRDLLKSLSSVSVGLGLIAIYLIFLNKFFALTTLSGMTTTESVILYTQIIRVVVLFVLGLKYQVQPIVPIIVFSFEALLIPPLLVLIILTGSAFYAAFMGLILTAWFGATALILTPYTVYGYARSMARETALSGILVIGAFELISVLFLSNLYTGLTQPVQGLSGLGTLIITQIRSEVGSGGVPNPTQDLLSSAGLLLFFIGLLFYMTLGSYSAGYRVRLPWMLLVSLAGILLAFIWVAQVSRLQPDILVVLTAPAVALFLVIWGTARGS